MTLSRNLQKQRQGQGKGGRNGEASMSRPSSKAARELDTFGKRGKEKSKGQAGQGRAVRRFGA